MLVIFCLHVIVLTLVFSFLIPCVFVVVCFRICLRLSVFVCACLCLSLGGACAAEASADRFKGLCAPLCSLLFVHL